MSRRTLQRLALRALDGICRLIDELAYRPAIVMLTKPLPRWWNCQLAHLAFRLDRRWGTGYYGSWGPGDPCDICGRRAAWLTIGGPIDEGEVPEPDATWLNRHALEVCFWCRLDPDLPTETRADLDRAISEARRRSVSWRWRYRLDR